MRKLIVTVLAAGSLAAVVPAIAQASPIRECGRIARIVPNSPAGLWNITTRNVACPYARRFAVQVTAHMAHHWAGFTCRHYFYNHGFVFDIRCVRGSQVIHWQGGD